MPAEEWTAQGEGDSVPADLIFFIDGVLLLLLLLLLPFFFIYYYFFLNWMVKPGGKCEPHISINMSRHGRKNRFQSAVGSFSHFFIF